MDLVRDAIVQVWLPSLDTSRLYRVVCFDHVSFDSEPARVGMIELANKKALPFWWPLPTLHAGLSDGTVNLLPPDSDAVLMGLRPSLTEAEKRYVSAIAPFMAGFVNEQLLALFDRHSRAGVLRRALKSSDCPFSSRTALMKALRRFLQGGRKEMSLVPEFRRCGGSGHRTIGNAFIGRPPTHGSQPRRNLTEVDRSLIKEGLEKFYYHSPVNSAMDAYHATMGSFFADHYDVRDGVALPVFEGFVPSLAQFRRVKEAEDESRGYEQVRKDREGEHEHNLKSRGRPGRATDFAPYSSVAQIDAAQIDINLVSERNRKKKIGTPTAYFLTDTESGEILGVSALPGHPSYLGLMLAIESSVTPKVDYCAQYGLTITADEWYAHHQADIYLTDLGSEMTSDDMQVAAVRRFGSRLDYTPRARPDLKALVENAARSVKRQLRRIPGRSGRGSDGRYVNGEKEAVCTYGELMFILLSIAIALNHSIWRGGAYADPEMLDAGIPLIPEAMYRWLLAHRMGSLRQPPLEFARKWLRPTVSASVTARGIQFPGTELHYVCDEALKDGWLARARIEGRTKVNLAYDPRNLTTTYVVSDDNIKWLPCWLTDTRFKNWSLKQAKEHTQTIKKLVAENHLSRVQARAVALARIDGTVAAATGKTRRASDTGSSTTTAENREEELKVIHGQATGAQAVSSNLSAAAPAPLTSSEESLYDELMSDLQGDGNDE